MPTYIWKLADLYGLSQLWLESEFSGLSRLAAFTFVDGFLRWLGKQGNGFTTAQLERLVGKHVDTQYRNSEHKPAALNVLIGFVAYIHNQPPANRTN